jgi:Peptidase M50B-like
MADPPGPVAYPGAVHHIAAAAARPLSSPSAIGSLWRRADAVLHHALTVQPAPPQWLAIGACVVALAIVASARAWPLARTVVTIVHEGGHAVVALATGQRRVRVRLYRDTAGETRSRGRSDGVGVALTAAAGYPAPALVGLGAAALLAIGHLTAMLLLGLVFLVALAIAVRNPYGLLAVIVTAAGIAVVCLYASPVVQAGFGYVMTWFLLFGSLRPVVELHRDRRRGRGWRSDADQLARLTSVPGGAWVAAFGLIAVAALALSVRWLLVR